MHSILCYEHKELLKECFSTDKELIEKWHIESGNGLDSCIERTCDDFKKANIDVYSLFDSSNLIGYYGIEQNSFLSGFFIKPEYRKREYITQFWNEVDKHFNDKYFAGIYNKNKPAFNFLMKRASIYYPIPEFQGIFVLIEKRI